MAINYLCGAICLARQTDSLLPRNKKREIVLFIQSELIFFSTLKYETLYARLESYERRRRKAFKKIDLIFLMTEEMIERKIPQR